jgi:hypothetical protein
MTTRTRTRRPSRRGVPTAALVVAALVLLAPARPTGQADRTGWKSYSNAGLGFSLRYPDTLDPDLKVSNELVFVDFQTREVDPARSDSGNVTALRIVVGEDKPAGDPISFYRSQKEYRDLNIGDRPAASYVGCGRGMGSCNWQVIIPGPRELRVFTFDRDERQKRGPEDARYPLLSMINSIVFHSTFPR